MNYTASCIEQLDLAAAQLKLNTAAGGRFALILTDNIVELMLHEQCRNAIDWDSVKWNRNPKYSVAERKEALGHDFCKKVSFCKKQLGRISNDEAETITIAHFYRNVLYHQGVKHDPILNAIARLYHDLACLLFGRLPLISYGSSSTVSKGSSSVVHGFLGNKDSATLMPEDIAAIAKLLAAAKLSTSERLQDVLSDYMTQRVEGFAQSLEFLVRDNPSRLNETEMIEHIQLYDLIFAEGSDYLAEVAKFQSPTDIKTLMQRLKADGTVTFRKSPVENWRRRATNLKAERNVEQALSKFHQFHIQMEEFEFLVNDAATTMAIELAI